MMPTYNSRLASQSTGASSPFPSPTTYWALENDLPPHPLVHS